MTTAGSPPNDDAVRDAIRQDLHSTLFVEAGAGTGKTAALVDRYVALVRSGVAVDRIAAITFTERAAAELRERVRYELEKTDPSEPTISQAIESLDRAQISTIHSFARSLLASFAPEAGIDPGFEVLSDLNTRRRVDDAWRAFLEELGGDPAARVIVDRVLSLGLRTSDIARLGKELATRGEIVRLLEANPLAAPEPPDIDLDALAADIDGTGWRNVDPSDNLRRSAEAMYLLIDDARRRPPEERQACLTAGLAELKAPSGGKQVAWGGAAGKAQAADDLKDVHESLVRFVAGCRASALAQLLPYLAAFARAFERDRARAGALTFDDLLLMTRDLMRVNPAVVATVRSRYDVILIDEFQDTDPSQMEIARLFAADPDTGAIDSGRLFLVGDPKQSIYRFRNADMTMYTETRRLLKESGATIRSLSRNKRSRRVIVDTVNAVFDKALGAEDDSVRVPYSPISHTREQELRGPGVAWFGGKHDALAREIRAREAQSVAAVCRTAMTEEWEVSSRAGDVSSARYRDIAILIPRRTGLTALERALMSEGIPYRVEGGSLIYGTQEIRDLINCLTAIDDPSDQVAIAGALRSPAFACSDVDLAEYRAAGGRFTYRTLRPDEPQGPVAEGLRVLASYHQRRHDTSVAALVEEFVTEQGVIEAAILDRSGRNAFRRMRFVAQQARAFEATGPESLRSFVSWLEGQSQEAILDNEGAGVDDDEDAVRILTIHGAKGLEFPIVVLAGLSAAPNNTPRTLALADPQSGRVALRVGSGKQAFELGDYDTLKDVETAHGNAEFGRLLYVAATRARDHLVVSLHHKRNSSTCAARRLIEAGIQEPSTELAVPSLSSRAIVGPFAGMQIDLPDDPSQEAFEQQREAVVSNARTRVYTSATAIGRAVDRAHEESEPWARGRGGTRLGRAVHAAVQTLPFGATEDVLQAICRAEAVAEAVPHRSKDVERLVRWIAGKSQAWQRAREAPRAMREVPFALVLDGRVLEGFIDLVIETPGGLEIVDWKTDHVTESELGERLQNYRLQAGLYTHGLEAATGRAVTAVTYVFAHPEREISPGDPAELARDAVAILARGGDVPPPA